MSEDARYMLELIERMVKALSSNLRAFIYQRGVDNPNLVLKVIRESGIQGIVDIRTISSKHGLYVVLINDAVCKAECKYNVCKGSENEECVDKCMEECRGKIIASVIERLNKYASRLGRKLGRNSKIGNSSATRN